MKNVDEFEIASVSARQGLKNGQSSAIVLEDVADGVVRDSRAAEGCATFLEFRGARNRNVSVYNNHISRAAKKYGFEGGAGRDSVTFGPPAD